MGDGFESIFAVTGIDAAALSLLWHIPFPAEGNPEVNKNGGGSSGDSSWHLLERYSIVSLNDTTNNTETNQRIDSTYIRQPNTNPQHGETIEQFLS